VDADSSLNGRRHLSGWIQRSKLRFGLFTARPRWVDREKVMKKLAPMVVGGGILLAALLLTGGALAQAAGTEGSEGNETDTAITGSALAEASAAALAFTGEGKVTGTEVGDEESYYEVEVTLDDGTQVDVQLDEAFGLVSSKTDSGSEG
jgi:hypothetical protein